MTNGTPDLASAAKSAADFLDSYTDESELARRSPLLVEIMRAHAAEVRSALAAHDQQDEPTAAIPLPGEGWYSVTVEHLVDKFEKQHPTQTWEVVSRCDGGGFSVEPMTYPEPGVSDTPEPDIPREPNGRPVVTFDAEGPWPEPQVSMIVDPVTGRDERAPATPEGGESGPESEKPSPGTVSQTELDDRAEFGVTQAELNVINDEVQAEAERAQPTDDELLARADHRAPAHVDVMYDDPDGSLIRDLASALRRKRDDFEHERDRRRHLRSRVDRLDSALRFIDRYGCTNYTRGRCLDDPSRSRDAKYSAEAWCDACVAADVLVVRREGQEETDGE